MLKSGLLVSTVCCGHAAVPTVEINAGVHMPLMMQGTPGKGFPESVIRSALEVGFTGIDSAFADPSYQTDDLRKVLKTLRREDIFITSKIPGASYVNPNETYAALDAAIQDLGLDYVDLMLSHGPGQWKNMTVESSLQQHWAAFEAFYQDGKARAIGVSNWCPRAIRSILKTATVVPHVNQVIYHAGMGDDPDGLMSFARRYNITVQAESASDQGNPVILAGEPYASIGKKYNKSGIQVAFRWLVQRGYPAITGSSSATHQAENIDVFDFELSEEELVDISSQEHCLAGNQVSPYCHVPYYRDGIRRVCNTDLMGSQAANWECDDNLQYQRALLIAGQGSYPAKVVALFGSAPTLCESSKSLCADSELGELIRESCKSSCGMPCQQVPPPESESLV